MAEETSSEAPKESKDSKKKRLLQKKFEKAVKTLGLIGKVKGLNETQVNFITSQLQKKLDEVKTKLSAKSEEVAKETVAAIPQ